MEKTAFRKILGDSPYLKIMDFLLESEGLDYSLSEMAENSGVSWATIQKLYRILEKEGIIKNTRTIGRAKMYRLNTENTTVKELRIIDNFLTEVQLLMETAKQKNKKIDLDQALGFKIMPLIQDQHQVPFQRI